SRPAAAGCHPGVHLAQVRRLRKLRALELDGQPTLLDFERVALLLHLQLGRLLVQLHLQLLALRLRSAVEVRGQRRLHGRRRRLLLGAGAGALPLLRHLLFSGRRLGGRRSRSGRPRRPDKLYLVVSLVALVRRPALVVVELPVVVGLALVLLVLHVARRAGAAALAGLALAQRRVERLIPRVPDDEGRRILHLLDLGLRALLLLSRLVAHVHVVHELVVLRVALVCRAVVARVLRLAVAGELRIPLVDLALDVLDRARRGELHVVLNQQRLDHLLPLLRFALAGQRLLVHERLHDAHQHPFAAAVELAGRGARRGRHCVTTGLSERDV
ncbi:hypothetical protein M885DRAFT_599858, partial [Pelagophyceae sp. CCMP2097]